MAVSFLEARLCLRSLSVPMEYNSFSSLFLQDRRRASQNHHKETGKTLSALTAPLIGRTKSSDLLRGRTYKMGKLKLFTDLFKHEGEGLCGIKNKSMHFWLFICSEHLPRGLLSVVEIGTTI